MKNGVGDGKVTKDTSRGRGILLLEQCPLLGDWIDTSSSVYCPLSVSIRLAEPSEIRNECEEQLKKQQEASSEAAENDTEDQNESPKETATDEPIRTESPTIAATDSVQVKQATIDEAANGSETGTTSIATEDTTGPKIVGVTSVAADAEFEEQPSAAKDSDDDVIAIKEKENPAPPKPKASKIQTCIVCEKLVKWKFIIVRNGDAKHLCDFACLKRFHSNPTIYLKPADPSANTKNGTGVMPAASAKPNPPAAVAAKNTAAVGSQPPLWEQRAEEEAAASEALIQQLEADLGNIEQELLNALNEVERMSKSTKMIPNTADDNENRNPRDEVDGAFIAGNRNNNAGSLDQDPVHIERSDSRCRQTLRRDVNKDQIRSSKSRTMRNRKMLRWPDYVYGDTTNDSGYGHVNSDSGSGQDSDEDIDSSKGFILDKQKRRHSQKVETTVTATSNKKISVPNSGNIHCKNDINNYLGAEPVKRKASSMTSCCVGTDGVDLILSQGEQDRLLALELQKQFEFEAKFRLNCVRIKGTDDGYSFRR